MGDRVSQRDIFNQCQTGLQGHGKLIKTLNKIYKQTEHEQFSTDFFFHLKYAMVVFKREPAVERMIDFVSKFLTILGRKEEKKDKGDSEDKDEEEENDVLAENKLLQETFDFLLKYHSAKDRAVRFRSCQLINKLLSNLGDDAQIDDELYDRLYECMLERLKDKCPVVRYNAVLAMSRLQDPTDENCPVIKAYLFLLNCDPHADVRRAVLNSIAPSTKTLSSIVGRTRDVKDTVRKAAYEVISEKIHVKALSIAVRLQLLNEGLNDRSEVVKQASTGKLLQAWMRTFEGSILSLLKSLDVEDSTEICGTVIETLFKGSTLSDIVQDFKLLGDKLLIPEEELTSESAFYWQMICRYIHKQGTEGDEYLEKVLPNCVDFCSYMNKYVDDLKTVDDPEVQLGREFIIEQLLLIASYMDTADSASKKAIESLLHNMVIADHVSHRLVKPLVLRICQLKGDGEQLVQYFAEVISEIREPITVVEKDLAEEQQRQLNLKVAGIRVKLNQYRDELEDAVRNQDFTKAAELKTSIAELDQEKAKILQEAEPAREEVRTERNDPLTIQKCQTIITEMLRNLKLNSVSPTLQMMIETQILPGIQNEDADVRNMAMQALGICCYLSKDLLVAYMPLFMQASQIDVELVRVTAIQVIFDLLLIYGLDVVNSSEGSSSPSEDESNTEDENPESVSSDNEKSRSSGNSGIASKLVSIISSFLDGESSELRTSAAEGLAKLLLSGRVNSSKILSHLILLWYNPLSEDETHLRDCLGVFFPLFALASRSNQEIVEEAFLPTLKTLLNAPTTSPLAEVNINNVAELLIPLTNSTLLSQNQNSADMSKDNPGHDNLSERVCNEILSDPASSHVKLWIKILNQMQVSPDNEVVLKDLRVLCYKMSKTVKDKFCIKNLHKFQNYINELASKFVTNDDDLENIEIEPVLQQDTEEETEEETNIQTPKRKRVRGLYSQNITLESEVMDLDLTQEVPPDIDVSCLMRRASTVSDTPSRRSRKNTTELALDEDDIFLKPDASRTKQSGIPENKESVEENVEAVEKEPVSTESVNLDKTEHEKMNKTTDSDKTTGKSTEKRKSDVEKTTPEKRSRTSDKESPEKSRSRSKERRRRSLIKEKSSPKSPSKSNKDKGGKELIELSPTSMSSGNNSRNKANSSKSSAKPKTSEKKGSQNKSPNKLSPKSPTRSRSEDTKQKTAISIPSSSKRALSSSPEKRSSSKRKASSSPEGRSSKSPDKRQRSIDASTNKHKLKRKASDRNSKSPEKKQRSISREEPTFKATEDKAKKDLHQINTLSKLPKDKSQQQIETDKQANKNVRQTQRKKTDEVLKPFNKSPVKTISADKKKADKIHQGKGASDNDTTSPRKTRGSLTSTIVVETPDGTSRRPTASPSPAISIAETPDSAISTSARRQTRSKNSTQGMETPVLPARSTRSVRGTPSTVSDNTPNPSPRLSTRGTNPASIKTPNPSPRLNTRVTNVTSNKTPNPSPRLTTRGTNASNKTPDPSPRVTTRGTNPASIKTPNPSPRLTTRGTNESNKTPNPSPRLTTKGSILDKTPRQSTRVGTRSANTPNQDLAQVSVILTPLTSSRSGSTKGQKVLKSRRDTIKDVGTEKATRDEPAEGSRSNSGSVSSPEKASGRTRRSQIISDSSSGSGSPLSGNTKGRTKTSVTDSATTTTTTDDEEEDQIRRRVKTFRKTTGSKPSSLKQPVSQKPVPSQATNPMKKVTSKSHLSIPNKTARVASPNRLQRASTTAATKKPSTPQSQKSDSDLDSVFSSPGSARSTRSTKVTGVTRGTRASNARIPGKSTSSSNLAVIGKSKPRWK